ncbi:MAG: hypothetical protein INR73_19490 [Williamsia sp.]|nr:hypothetical protein [Williamsia sp.]
MRQLFSALLLGFFLLSCNSPEQNSTTGNTADSTTVNADTAGDTRGEKGTGVDNTGGTPGPGTLTDTSKGKTDTLDHTSQKGK